MNRPHSATAWPPFAWETSQCCANRRKKRKSLAKGDPTLSSPRNPLPGPTQQPPLPPNRSAPRLCRRPRNSRLIYQAGVIRKWQALKSLRVGNKRAHTSSEICLPHHRQSRNFVPLLMVPPNRLGPDARAARNHLPRSTSQHSCITKSASRRSISSSRRWQKCEGHLTNVRWPSQRLHSEAYRFGRPASSFKSAKPAIGIQPNAMPRLKRAQTD